MVSEKLRENYKKTCKEETKRDLNKIINEFVDDDNVDKDYKEKIINIIVVLLTL